MSQKRSRLANGMMQHEFIHDGRSFRSAARLCYRESHCANCLPNYDMWWITPRQWKRLNKKLHRRGVLWLGVGTVNATVVYTPEHRLYGR